MLHRAVDSWNGWTRGRWWTVLVPIFLFGWFAKPVTAQPGIVPPPAKLAPLLAQLQDPDVETRVKAAQALGESRNVEAGAALAQALRDSTPPVRAAAVMALYQIEYPGACRVLIGVLNDPEPSVRSTAALVLEWLLKQDAIACAPGWPLNHPAIAPLLAALQDPEPSVRAAVAHALGCHLNQPAITPLLATMQDSESAVRAAVTDALGQIDDPAVLDALLATLRDPDPTVRTAAARALGNVSDLTAWASISHPDINLANPAVAKTRATLRWEEIIAALRALRTDPDPTVCAMATIACFRFTAPEGIRDLLPLLTHPAVTIRREVLTVMRPPLLLLAGDDALAVGAACVAALPGEQDIDTRHSLLWLLSALQYAPAAPTLITMLNEPDLGLRCQIISTLGMTHNAQAVEPLLPLLNDKIINVRISTAAALSWFQDARAVEPLLRAIRDPEAFLRAEAIGALGNQRGPRAVEAVLTCLNDPETLVRLAAIKALENLRDPRTVESLLPLLSDPKESIRAATIRALGLIADPQALGALLAQKETSVHIRALLLRALGHFDDVRVSVSMRAALLNPDEQIRYTAAFWLFDAVNRNKTDLVELLLRDEEIEVRRAVINTLVACEWSDHVLTLLLQALRDTDADLRLQVVTCLGKHADVRCAEPLQALARDDPDARIRTAAQQSLDGLPTDK